MTETAETTEQETTKRTLLETWSALLENIDTQRESRITPQMGNRAIITWPRLTFADLPRYFELYYEIMQEMREVVLAEIELAPGCLDNVDNDGEDNEQVYLNILFGWQTTILIHETRWDATDPEAAHKLAALADAQGFFLGQEGLVAHLGLESVGFTHDDEDSEALREALQEWKDAL